MRALIFPLSVTLFAACNMAGLCKAGDVDCVVEDNNLVDPNTGDTGVDTGEPVDTSPPPDPDPVFYDGAQATLETRSPVQWVPLSYDADVVDTTIAGFDLKVNLGANVSGSTEVSVGVGSLLEEVERESWEQQFVGLDDAGTIDASMSINFPITVTLDSLTINVATLPGVNIPDFSQVIPQHVFDTLLLEGDGGSTSFNAPALEWSWTSPVIDPAYWAPFVQFTVVVKVEYGAEFGMAYYELLEHGRNTLIERQTAAADAQEASFYVGGMGEEAAEVAFDASGMGRLKNNLVLRPSVSVDLWYTSGPYYTVPAIERTWDIGDDGAWDLKLDKDELIHKRK